MLEQPLAWLFLGAFAAAVTLAVWVQLRSPAAIKAFLGIVLATILAIAVERWIQTDREAVVATLHQIADALEANDVEGVLTYLADGLPQKQQVRQQLQRVRIQRVSIKRNLRVEVYRSSGGKAAEARFNAVVTATDRDGLAGTQVVPRFVVLQFRQQAGQWQVHSFQTHDPREGLRGHAQPP